MCTEEKETHKINIHMNERIRLVEIEIIKFPTQSTFHLITRFLRFLLQIEMYSLGSAVFACSITRVVCAMRHTHLNLCAAPRERY